MPLCFLVSQVLAGLWRVILPEGLELCVVEWAQLVLKGVTGYQTLELAVLCCPFTLKIVCVCVWCASYALHKSTFPYPLQGGDTPLHMAAGNGHAETVRLLLDKGADKGAKISVRGGRRGWTIVVHGHAFLPSSFRTVIRLWTWHVRWASKRLPHCCISHTCREARSGRLIGVPITTSKGVHHSRHSTLYRSLHLEGSGRRMCVELCRLSFCSTSNSSSPTFELG